MPLHKTFAKGSRVDINGVDIEFQKSTKVTFHNRVIITPKDPTTEPAGEALQDFVIKLERLRPAARIATLRKTNAWGHYPAPTPEAQAARVMAALRFRAGVNEIMPTDPAFQLKWAKAALTGDDIDPTAADTAIRIVHTHSTDTALRDLATEIAFAMRGELT